MHTYSRATTADGQLNPPGDADTIRATSDDGVDPTATTNASAIPLPSPKGRSRSTRLRYLTLGTLRFRGV